MTAESGIVRNRKRGLRNLRAHDPRQEEAAEEWRDDLLSRVEEHLDLLRRHGPQEAYQEACQRAKCLRVVTSARYWLDRRGLSAEVVLAEFGGVK